MSPTSLARSDSGSSGRHLGAVVPMPLGASGFGTRGAPEISQLTFGFLPLTDAAPIIVAHANGWFREHGIESTLRREPSWTALRDSLNRGDAHGAQMLFAMPVAAACGLLGSAQKPLVVPWVLHRNGQAITLHRRHVGNVTSSAGALRAAALEGRDRGRPLVFGHTLRVGTHALWLRYWLAAGGIDPENDVALITVPPPQMVANLRSGRMDGFCVGEPWNARAISENIGFTATTSQEIWPDHPDKVCAFTEDFAQRHPRSVVAALKALHQAARWLDDPANHSAAAELLARPEHLNTDAATIFARLGSSLDYGDGRTQTATRPLTFSRRDASRPRPSHAIWFLSQLRRWGLIYGAPDYAALAGRIIRPDFHAQALTELGEFVPASPDAAETLFDGTVFNPDEPEAYARSFAIKNLQG